MLRDLICLVLVLCICLSVVMAPKAHAISELVIVGAIALTLSAVAAVVILAAEPLGLKEPIMAAAQHGFQSPREFVADLLDRYGASQGLQRFVMLDKFQKGLMITVAGKVILDKAISDFLTEFFGWAWSESGGDLVSFAISPGASTVYFPPETNTIGLDLSVYPNIVSSTGCTWVRSDTNPNITGQIYLTSGNAVGAIYSNAGNTNFVYVSNEPFSVSYSSLSGKQYTQSISSKTTTNGWSRYVFTNTLAATAVVTAGYNNDLSSIQSNAGLGIQYILLNGTSGVVGGDDPTYDEDGLVLPAPESSNVLDVSGALTLPAPISGTTTATQYLEAAADAITAGTGSLEYEDENGNTLTGTLEGTGEIDLTQVGAQSAELEGAIDVADSVGSETLDNYTIDLKEFFPFCIPFDLWDMLNLLESAPAPVSVEWQFDFGDLGEYEMEINLEEWNSVAQTLRTMELLAFCFGLAMLTKRILMGS